MVKRSEKSTYNCAITSRTDFHSFSCIFFCVAANRLNDINCDFVHNTSNNLQKKKISVREIFDVSLSFASVLIVSYWYSFLAQFAEK